MRFEAVKNRGVGVGSGGPSNHKGGGPVRELLCPGRCGFRVPANYYEGHPAFTPGVCPNCGLIVDVVEAGTNQRIPGATLDAKGRVLLGAVKAGGE